MKTEGMRKASEAPIPWKSPLVVLLHIGADTVTAASSIGGKRSLLREAAPGDLILAAWPGDYRQDTFVVDNLDVARAAFGI